MEQSTLLKRQAITAALLNKKLDPNRQSREVAEGIIRAVKQFGEAVSIEPKRVEEAEFMDIYEELWARFQKIGTELTVETR